MGRIGADARLDVIRTVGRYLTYAPNQGGDETPRQHIRSAFRILRSRLSSGNSIQAATGALDRIAESYRDM